MSTLSLFTKTSFGQDRVTVGVSTMNPLRLKLIYRTIDKDRSTGRVVAVWPGSSIHFMEMIASPRWEDYEIRYQHVGQAMGALVGNPFILTCSSSLILSCLWATESRSVKHGARTSLTVGTDFLLRVN